MSPEDQLNQGFARLHPSEAARQLESYEPLEAAEILKPISSKDVAAVLGACQPGVAARIVECLNPNRIAEVIGELPMSIAHLALRQLQPDVQAQVINQLGPLQGMRFRRALAQPKQTAGSLADPRVVTLPPDITVEEGKALLRRNSRQAGYYVYVVGRDAKLEGVLTMKALFMADPQDVIASVMSDQVVAIPADLTKEEIIKHPFWQQYPTLPVVERDKVFLGMLRYRTLQQVIEESATRRVPGSLPAALIELWEAYSLAGIRVMTQLSGMAEPHQGHQNTHHGESSF